MRRLLVLFFAVLVALPAARASAEDSTCVVSDDGTARRQVGACAGVFEPGRVEWTGVVPQGTVVGWTVRWRALDGTLLATDRCDVALDGVDGGSSCTSSPSAGGYWNWTNGGGASGSGLGVAIKDTVYNLTTIPVKVSVALRAHKDGRPFRGTVVFSLSSRPA